MQKLLFSLLVFSLTAYGQPGSGIGADIRNTKTAKHINVPGTRLFIVAPPDFTVATTFVGLQKGEHALFNIYDLVGGNFYTNAATFSREAFEQKGVKVFDYKEIRVDGYPAKFISMQADAATNGYAMVFGDTTFSTMIMAFYPANDEATSKQIITALNTIWYDKSKTIDPFENAFFSLDDHNSKLKFFKYAANLYVYTNGGLDNTKDKDSPFLLATPLPGDKSTSAQSIGEMMITRVEEYGLKDGSPKNISTEKINGYETYEVEVYGDMQGKKSLVYTCVVAKGDKLVTFQGIAKTDLEANLQEFKKLARTVRIK